jgi:omega-amidase
VKKKNAHRESAHAHAMFARGMRHKCVPLASSMCSSSAAGVEVPKFKIALCQMLCGEDKQENITEASRMVREAAGLGAKLVSLPECWNSPYATSSFPAYAEAIPSCSEELDASANPSTFMLSSLAKELGIYLVGGSIPEREADSVYNTCVVFAPDGAILAKHRKVHLFDIDIPGKQTFRESDTLSAGCSPTTFDSPFGKIGIAICYDIRFPELSMMMSNAGCSLLLYPGAFNTTTGPMHWELLQRARAVDNQLFVATVSPARNPDSEYQAWGHSTLVSPWGNIIATTEHDPAIVVAEIDMNEVDEMRGSIPVLKQKRDDIYSLLTANL